MAMAERVNIPVLPWGAIVETEQWNLRALTDMRVERCRRRQGQANPPLEPNLIVRSSLRGNLIARVTILPRKSAKHILMVPVPQTDTRSRVEHTEALRDSWLRN